MPNRSVEQDNNQVSAQFGRDYRASEQPSKAIIDRLASVVRTGRTARDILFIGWSADGKPAVCRSVSGLSTAARGVYDIYKRGVAGYEIPLVKFTDLEPKKFNYLKSLIDSPGAREDIFSLSITSGDGADTTVQVGEQEMLTAIIAANNPLLDTSSEASTSFTHQIVTPESLYTLIIGGYGTDTPDTLGFAILFKSVAEGVKPEATFRTFLEDVLGNLIANDLEQDPKDRKGYATAALRYLARDNSKQLPTGSLARFFFRSKQDADEATAGLHDFFYGPKDESKGSEEKRDIDLDKLQSLDLQTIFKMVTDFHLAASKYFAYHR